MDLLSNRLHDGRIRLGKGAAILIELPKVILGDIALLQATPELINFASAQGRHRGGT